mmetsp:Transcript_14800/g.27397  ORF Transcript_14800/g.27397 Transcript_14800/m.27397 type:complete len:202 (+) Transcript_14800:1217-1822(+)
MCPNSFPSMVPLLSSSKNLKASFIALLRVSFMSSAALAVARVSTCLDFLEGDRERPFFGDLAGDLTMTSGFFFLFAFLTSILSSSSSSPPPSSSPSSSSSSSAPSRPAFLPFFFLDSSRSFFPAALAAVRFSEKFLLVICFTTSPYLITPAPSPSASFLKMHPTCPSEKVTPRASKAALKSSPEMRFGAFAVDAFLKISLY